MRAILGLLSGLAVFACAPGGKETPDYPTLSGEAPLIIAHRGASGTLPEHTIEAYTLAVQHGADFIEPDLVMTKDGVLIARHDRYLSTTTDVSDRPEFAGRKRVQETSGSAREDWWAEDFTLDEIKTLRARQPYAGRSTDYDDLYLIPTFDEVVALATASGVGLYPETKSPSYHTAIGLDMKAPLLGALDGVQVPIFIQSFEAQILRELNTQTELKLVQLVSGDPRAAMAGFEPPLDEIGAYADGVGPYKMLLWASPGAPSDFVSRAHGLGLTVHPWTFRDDNLPDGYELPEEEFEAYWAMGVDGVFTDFPETAAKLRQSAE
ncbi:MAG: glycerophosphodiester phosphodiesterase family protein [Pseudomonadota bacterium]